MDFPPFYTFRSLLVQNFRDSTVLIPAGSVLGRFTIEGENHEITLIARHIPRDQFVHTAEAAQSSEDKKVLQNIGEQIFKC